MNDQLLPKSLCRLIFVAARLPDLLGKPRYEVMKFARALGTHTREEWLALVQANDYRCVACEDQFPLFKLTKDHIRPVTLGGSDEISNIQPLCQWCNSYKGQREINFMEVPE
jgi:5-methylcytosine-specific restriction endonuclease McrA